MQNVFDHWSSHTPVKFQLWLLRNAGLQVFCKGQSLIPCDLKNKKNIAKMCVYLFVLQVTGDQTLALAENLLTIAKQPHNFLDERLSIRRRRLQDHLVAETTKNTCFWHSALRFPSSLKHQNARFGAKTQQCRDCRSSVFVCMYRRFRKERVNLNSAASQETN